MFVCIKLYLSTVGNSSDVIRYTPVQLPSMKTKPARDKTVVAIGTSKKEEEIQLVTIATSSATRQRTT
jgi:hypothetical protein